MLACTICRIWIAFNVPPVAWFCCAVAYLTSPANRDTRRESARHRFFPFIRIVDCEHAPEPIIGPGAHRSQTFPERNIMKFTNPLLLAVVAIAGPATTQAAVVQLNVTVENLAAPNGVSFAPLRVGFHQGVFDAFNLGQAASAPIISVAEGGSGSAWFPAFAAADPTATLGSVLPPPGGPLLPGATSTASFTVNTGINQFFTFGAMVVPSNDFFIGNDDPMEYHLFDASGALLVNNITVTAREIWDAGSEIFDPLAAAFVGDNSLRADQNSVVAFNFAELAAFNGLLTGAGYTFNSQLAADTGVYRISFAVAPAPVPLPAALPLLFGSLGLLGVTGRRKA
jgi:hypothetical protein